MLRQPSTILPSSAAMITIIYHAAMQMAQIQGFLEVARHGNVSRRGRNDGHYAARPHRTSAGPGDRARPAALRAHAPRRAPDGRRPRLPPLRRTGRGSAGERHRPGRGGFSRCRRRAGARGRPAGEHVCAPATAREVRVQAPAGAAGRAHGSLGGDRRSGGSARRSTPAWAARSATHRSCTRRSTTTSLSWSARPINRPRSPTPR